MYDSSPVDLRKRFYINLTIRSRPPAHDHWCAPANYGNGIRALLSRANATIAKRKISSIYFEYKSGIFITAYINRRQDARATSTYVMMYAKRIITHAHSHARTHTSHVSRTKTFPREFSFRSKGDGEKFHSTVYEGKSYENPMKTQRLVTWLYIAHERSWKLRWFKDVLPPILGSAALRDRTDKIDE